MVEYPAHNFPASKIKQDHKCSCRPEGSGTLRYNNSEVLVKQGDLIGKPTGPDSATQLIADRGEALPAYWTWKYGRRELNSQKDVIVNPDFNEILISGLGWEGLFRAEALGSCEDFASITTRIPAEQGWHLGPVEKPGPQED